MIGWPLPVGAKFRRVWGDGHGVALYQVRAHVDKVIIARYWRGQHYGWAYTAFGVEWWMAEGKTILIVEAKGDGYARCKGCRSPCSRGDLPVFCSVLGCLVG